MTTQKNPALDTKFMVTITGRRELSFSIQATNLSGIILGESPVPWRGNNTTLPGNSLDFDPVAMNIILDEGISQWLDIYDWMIECANATDSVSYADNAELIITSNQNVEIVRVLYKSIWPTSLSGLDYTLIGDESVLTSVFTLKHDGIKVTDIVNNRVIEYDKD